MRHVILIPSVRIFYGTRRKACFAAPPWFLAGLSPCWPVDLSNLDRRALLAVAVWGTLRQPLRQSGVKD